MILSKYVYKDFLGLWLQKLIKKSEPFYECDSTNQKITALSVALIITRRVSKIVFHRVLSTTESTRQWQMIMM